MIEVINLSKRFGKRTALDCLNIIFQDGCIHGLIGRNGSGKTVLMKCICGLYRPTEGIVKVNGKIIGKDQDFIENAGIIIEQTGFLMHQSGYRNLYHLAMINRKIGKNEICSVLKQVGLADVQDKKVKTYSLGMRQRLSIAQALMEDPDLLILDEPFNGLDRNGVVDIRQLLMELKSKGKTIILASHYHEDIKELCDVVYELDHGRIVSNGEISKK